MQVSNIFATATGPSTVPPYQTLNWYSLLAHDSITRQMDASALCFILPEMIDTNSHIPESHKTVHVVPLRENIS